MTTSLGAQGRDVLATPAVGPACNATTTRAAQITVVAGYRGYLSDLPREHDDNPLRL